MDLLKPENWVIFFFLTVFSKGERVHIYLFFGLGRFLFNLDI